MDFKHYSKGDKKLKYVKKIATLDDYPKIEGYNLSKKFNFDEFVDSYFNTGFQATNLKIAVDIIKKMRDSHSKIILGFTSNIMSSGLREFICYLAKNKLIDALVTTTGGVEEDMIKTLKPFVIGQQRIPGAMLLENGINRIGNIFVPNDRYAYFEKSFVPFLEKLYAKQNNIGGSEFIYELGDYINNKESVLFWASKNKIPVFCPVMTDGALGDMFYFFKKKHPNFNIDICADMVKIIDFSLNAEKLGAIILGAGVVKHHILNAAIFHEGTDFTVLINTAHEFDGSDSGADPEESISWGKIRPHSNYVKVNCDATIAFPLIVKAAFVDYVPKEK